MVGTIAGIAHHTPTKFTERHPYNPVFQAQQLDVILKRSNRIAQLLHQSTMQSHTVVGTVYLLTVGVETTYGHHIHRSF